MLNCAPIVLDLDGDGIEYVTLDQPLIADPDGDGRYDNYAWVRPDDGILVYDENNDGIGQHEEWVLTSFVRGARTDLEALRAFDSNGDGVLNAADELFSKIKIARDLDQDGKLEAGELASLADHGIVSINLVAGVQAVSPATAPQETAPGVYTFNTGTFTRSNGTQGAFADVALEKTHYAVDAYTDATVKVISYGGAQAWAHLGTHALGIDLGLASYAGYNNFVDFFGNDGNDWVRGTAAANTLSGGGGADTLLGEGGDDLIVADHADLTMGNVQGGEGYDTLVYVSDAGIHFDAWSRSFEMVMGGAGNDMLYTSAGALGTDGVVLIGGAGNDVLMGHDGDDYLIGGEGADILSGGHGDDVFLIDGSDAWTSITGGASLGAGDTVMVDTTGSYYFGNMWQQGIENYHGGSGADTVYSSRSDSGYWTQNGANRISGGAGNDYVYGGAGADSYFWQRGDGHDVFVDKDYGETKGDVLALGPDISTADVTISRSGSDLIVSVAGTDGGSVRLVGFAAEYGPHDLLFVNDKFYDLNQIKSVAYPSVNLAGMSPVTPPAGDCGCGGGGGGGSSGGGGGTGGFDPNYHEPPILLDLDGDGFELISPKKSGIYFDWDGDGVKEETGWAGPDDGFLVLDRNGDGQVNDGSEIAFGSWSGKKQPFVTDLEGLRQFDSNGNGSLDEGDDAFGQFRIWRDANSDAVVDAGEMVTLDEIGFVAMSLNGYEIGEEIKKKQNVIFATTDVAMANGSSIKAADLFIAYRDRHSGRTELQGEDMLNYLEIAAAMTAGRLDALGEATPHVF